MVVHGVYVGKITKIYKNTFRRGEHTEWDDGID